MQDISKEYKLLFQAISTATDALDALRRELLTAQQLAEFSYITQESIAPDDTHSS